jgi:esterase
MDFGHFAKVIFRVGALAALISVCHFYQVQAAPKWPLPEGVKSVEVNGYDMAYQEVGSGPPLVLVHGAMTDYRYWYMLVPEFAKNYRVIAVSLRHYYPEKWDGKGDDFSYEQHAADVAALIKKLDLGKVHLLGHSRGGGVVVNVAKTHPEVIKTLILADATGFESMLPKTAEDEKPANAGRDLVKTLQKNLADGPTWLCRCSWTRSMGPERGPVVRQS